MLAFYLSTIDNAESRDRFVELYERNETFLRRLSLKYARGNTQDAEEILQETWLHMAKKISGLRFDSEKAEKAYLTIVLRNCSRNYWRKEARKQEYEMPWDTNSEWPDTSGVDVENYICAIDTQ